MLDIFCMVGCISGLSEQKGANNCRLLHHVYWTDLRTSHLLQRQPRLVRIRFCVGIRICNLRYCVDDARCRDILLDDQLVLLA